MKDHDQHHPEIDELIASSPWPDDARALIGDLGITDDRRARAAAVLAGASRSMTKAVRRDPSLLDVVDSPADFAAEKTTLVAPDDDDALDGLRRWKRRQLLRIALRDLLGEADLATVGRELSVLADACLARALAIADDGPPLAVIGMGKLGGGELNYASDVDIVFVHEGDSAAAARRARRVLEILTAFTAEGGGVPGGHRAATRGRRRSPQPHPRSLRQLLRPLGGALGAPGLHQDATVGR